MLVLSIEMQRLPFFLLCRVFGTFRNRLKKTPDMNTELDALHRNQLIRHYFHGETPRAKNDSNNDCKQFKAQDEKQPDLHYTYIHTRVHTHKRIHAHTNEPRERARETDLLTDIFKNQVRG